MTISDDPGTEVARLMGHSPVSTAYMWLLNDLLCCNEGFSELQTPKEHGGWPLSTRDLIRYGAIRQPKRGQNTWPAWFCLVLPSCVQDKERMGGFLRTVGAWLSQHPLTSEFISHVSVVDRLGEGLFS